MRNHWSCSRFADFLRGESKPKALGLEEWKDWRKRVKSKRPVRYCLAERFLPALQKFVFFPADAVETISNYCRNRFVNKTHFLKTGLKPGSYHELDERIIHGLFNELKDFVEVELAHIHSYKDRRYKFRNGRCPQAGIDHLKWAASLTYGKGEFVENDDPDYGKPTPQAESAVKIMDLYGWWTETRPNRPDPMEASGLNGCYESPENNKDKKVAFKKLEKIEKEYEREDDKMLVQLVKLRRHLWT